MKEVFSYSIFKLGSQDFTVGQLILAVILMAIVFAFYRTILKRFFPKVFNNTAVTEVDSSKLGRIFRGLIFLILVLILIITLKLDRNIYSNGIFQLTILHLIQALIFFQVARLLDWLISNLFIHNYYIQRDSNKESVDEEKQDSESSAKKTVQYIFYSIVLIYMLSNFKLDIPLFTREINGTVVNLRLTNFVHAILILLIARLVIWVITQLILYNIFNRNKVDLGSRYAINQLVKYIIYIFAVILALDAVGINMNLLLGGAAALLVGIGLGLQQTFNDFVSGIVLLFERSVSMGDVLEIDGEVGTVKKIGLRASILETRGNISLVVPNHKLVNEKVINWNHFDDRVRFVVEVGVAYGSDTSLVKSILLDSVKDNPYVTKFPAPIVRFQEFGPSSLDFKLFFFSRNLRVIEDIKSDIRLEIDKLFRENGISIPFPQQVVTIKK